jgi:hypothetical protein
METATLRASIAKKNQNRTIAADLQHAPAIAGRASAASRWSDQA